MLTPAGAHALQLLGLGLTGLTHSSVHFIVCNSRPSARQALDALRQMPELSHLVLRYMSHSPFCNAYKARPRHVHLNFKVCSYVYLNLTGYTTETSDLDYCTRNNRPHISQHIPRCRRRCQTRSTRIYVLEGSLAGITHVTLNVHLVQPRFCCL